MADWRDLIAVQPDKLGGKPSVHGMRVSIADVLEYLASGMSMDDVLACVACAAARERGTVQLHA